jgi:hypothetical protein
MNLEWNRPAGVESNICFSDGPIEYIVTNKLDGWWHVEIKFRYCRNNTTKYIEGCKRKFPKIIETFGVDDGRSAAEVLALKLLKTVVYDELDMFYDIVRELDIIEKKRRKSLKLPKENKNV